MSQEVDFIVIPVHELSMEQQTRINEARESVFGKDAGIADFHAHFGAGAMCLLLGSSPEPAPAGASVVNWRAFCIVREMPPIRVQSDEFPCVGVCSVISLVPGQGYGKQLMTMVRDFVSHRYPLHQALGFTGATNFFKQCEAW